ncbi:Y4yA family PLP-dependent enzyme [Nocardia sp. NPDC051030]|uniref:Y4yA family PLP-dependent enzyme n=1 Tax=Nocardia sp. NPDC051030 TaxID=3155162 RepID=UPI00342546AF
MKTLTVPSEICDITAAPMPAHRAEWEERLLAHPNLLRTIADRIGGPFHVMHPETVIANIRAFQEVFDRAGVVGAIYYGKKANKASCVVDACAEAGAGVDVSSIGEFDAALAGGIRGRALMVTGPAKSDELLRKAAGHRALIAVDSPDELARLIDTGIAARVLLRVQPDESNSRFGMDATELDHAMQLVRAESVRLEGFSFHLTGYKIAPRAALAAELLDRCHDALRRGHPVTTISIGGGFGVDYVPAAAWRAFREGVNPRWFHGGRIQNHSLYYPYHFPKPGPAMLEAILEHGGLANRLRDAGIRLAIEPGRALLDRAGSTVFQVQGVKTRTALGHPYRILTVNGTSLSLSEQWFDSEYLPDPVLWPRRPGTMTPTCVGGSSCLEADMLSWRRIPLPRLAETDDLLIYPNTAGYQMDSNESAFHQLPIPPKIVLQGGNGQFGWAPDT